MNEKPKRKLGWCLLRWGLIGLAALITLAALLVTEENWRGKRAWENYQRTAAARGERLDLASVIPPAVLDDQNFFCAPIVSASLQHLRTVNDDSSSWPDFRMKFEIYRGDSKLWPEQVGDWQKSKLTNLKDWQDYLEKFGETSEAKTNGFPVPASPQSPAIDVLTALSIYNPELEELRQAAARPEMRLPLDYENGFDAATKLLPWLAETKRCAQFLQLRSVAGVQAGQGAAALADIKLLLRVNDSLRDQPFLISHLVRIAIQAITLQPIYEGLAQHCWDDAQLADLESTLASEDFLADYQTAMRGEKICAIDAFEKQRLTRKTEFSDANSKPVTVSLRTMPAAFFYQNKFWFAQWNDLFTALVDVSNRMVSPAAFGALDADAQAQLKHYSIYKVQALMTVPAVGAAVIKFARIQSQTDLARTACVLERFRLAHGNYPETLAVLAPQFIEKISHDVINGKPLNYRRTDDGKFVLYSVGWDETDDGGKIFQTKNGTVDQKKGDWVWKY